MYLPFVWWGSPPALVPPSRGSGAARYPLRRRVVEGSPEIQAGEGAARPPLVRDSLELLGPGQFIHSVGDLDGTADTEVSDGDDVLPGQVEHQEHLGGPLADSLDLDQLRDHVLVRQVLDLIEIETAVLDSLRQIAKEFDLGVGEARLAQRRLPLAEQRLRCRRLSAELSEQLLPDRAPRFGGELLTDDRPGHRLEWIGPAAAAIDLRVERALLLHHALQH